MEDGGFEVEKRISLYGRASSDIVLLTYSIPQTFWREAQRVRVKTLYKTVLSFLETLKRAAQSGLEFYGEAERPGRDFP